MANSEFLYETNDAYKAATDSKIASNRAKGMLARFNDQELLAFLFNSTSPFLMSLYSSIAKYGKLTDKQLACAVKSFNEHKAKLQAKQDAAKVQNELTSKMVRITANVQKGGKNGCDCLVDIICNTDINHTIKKGLQLRINATNTRKGDMLSNLFIDPVTLNVIYNNARITRYNPQVRQAYSIDVK